MDPLFGAAPAAHRLRRSGRSIRERRGNYLLFAVGEDRDTLADLCRRLMDGEPA